MKLAVIIATGIVVMINPSLNSVLKKARAGASVFGKLRPNESPSYENQVLMVFLVEMEDSLAAQELLEMSKKKRRIRR